ncbi:MAG: hypothetical protein Q8865_11075, partial [Bacillota bacterium]|nr:hypothetical protein [Bacillota bacterium]
VFEGYLYFFYKVDSFYSNDLSTGKTEQLDCITSYVIDFTFVNNIVYYISGGGLYQYDIGSKINKELIPPVAPGYLYHFQFYKGSIYYSDKMKLYRYDIQSGTKEAVSPNVGVYHFQILNDTVFFGLRRAPLDFSYIITLSRKLNYVSSVVGNHIFYLPLDYKNDHEEIDRIWMMRTDGSEDVMLRKSGRSYVDPNGNPVDDVPGIETGK